ncbi:MAG: DNA polymerase II large subunit [Candidatus Altiarchaeales archaeon ex4484_2]|nr:MAG: DNA polymerase II large subunit [Candidatus Altiarchaeales archaeon ex4484_2]
MRDEEYFQELKEKIEEVYKIANEARSRNFDPDSRVEAIPAGDLATRVEGLVGPKGIAEKIKEIGRENIKGIIEYILSDISTVSKEEKEKRVEQALRTTLAILTEGVVAAPIEGISKIDIKNNPDGSQYLSIYFAGPIRSAGGTAQGLAVVIGDYLRKKVGLVEYRPTNDEIERYVEEIKIYNDRVTRLQYLPRDDDIREIVKNTSVCVDGEPTEKREVSIHRDLERVDTNRIRGGICLVIAEGIAQKAPKLMKHTKNLGLDWSWLSSIAKGKSGLREENSAGDKKIKPISTFMSEVVGGRPIFSAPSAKGGFRLRYGRNRTSGIAAKSVHPATMVLADGFIATGTQVKVERPGKGCIITECDSIEGPLVRLRNGSVVRVESASTAMELKKDLDEILFLGDILISYGDFLQTNTKLHPAGYCEEWWAQEASKACEKINLDVRDPDEAVELSLKHKIPLHPRYTFHWEDVGLEKLEILVEWLLLGEIDDKNKELVLEPNPEAKEILEHLGVPHTFVNEKIRIREYKPLMYPLKAFDGKKLDKESFREALKEFKGKDIYGFVEKNAPITVKRKSGTYIGARMGRPEKAKERKMQPAVHSLFPIGNSGGKERLINVSSEKNMINVEIARYYCDKCHSRVYFPVCHKCGNKTTLKRICPSCNIETGREMCPRCKTKTLSYEKMGVDIKKLWREAINKVGKASKVKGVKGMISEFKIPEPLEKGILRSRNDVYVFKDGTIRFDSTDAPMTHFKPREIETSLEKLRDLGYDRDYKGEKLVDEEQILELRPQDVIIPKSGAIYLLRVSYFIDDLLKRFYGMERFYNLSSVDELIGHLIIGLAPHTSAGITGRIVGFTRANVCFAHPYWHAAKRRNADGDEDAFMLALDTLINFSRKYLPASRGGKMDAPLVVTTLMDAKEVDDEAHKIEIVDKYPLDFYDKTWEFADPSDVDVKIAKDVLECDPFNNLLFTHSTTDATGPILKSQYLKLTNMDEKVGAQLGVAEKIRAIDERVVAELVINSHFLRDTYGNLRAFSRQKFRCVNCNASYRRIPLGGKCTKCGGKLLLTVTKGSVEKYLGTSMKLVEKYNCSPYMKQRLTLLRKEIDSLFTNDLSKQVALSEFM